MYQFGTRPDKGHSICISAIDRSRHRSVVVRANQSITALGKQSCFGAITPHLENRAATSRLLPRRGQCGRSTTPSEPLALRQYQPDAVEGTGEGLLHDARNLVGTIGLYCDLLSMPGVLKPEHRQYPEELRLLGARSKSLIDHLMQSLFALQDTAGVPLAAPGSGRGDQPSGSGIQNGGAGAGRGEGPVSLRSIVERCSGLLNRVANGRRIEITYGPAAAVSVRVPEEAVERILVNLVRNAAAAMSVPPSLAERSLEEDSEEEVPQDAICIVVGPTVSRVGEHRPWPFQRVRLVVEDAGRGMSSQRLELLLNATGATPRSGHGIGFRVVRDLVAASEGEIRVMSEPEIGTRVQIEWPVAAMAVTENETNEVRNLPRHSFSSSRLPIALKSSAACALMPSVLRDVRMAVTH